MDATSPYQADKKTIFIDTCIIQYLGNSNSSLATRVTECLNSLKDDEYALVISEITFYENLHGLWGMKAEKADAVLRAYEYKKISRLVLLIAALLGGLYHDERRDDITMGDKIIAATALIESGFVLTANHKDYPNPFFLIEKEFALPYKLGQNVRTLDIALYRPNISLIARRIKEKE